MMRRDDPQHWLDRLVQEVIDFRFDHFQLGHDLRQLDAVRRVGATEAVILYGGRILEVLTIAALRELRILSTANLCSDLITLEQYNLLPRQTRYWAHALRRLGNAARHVKSAQGPDDADLAVCLVQRWLEWFFQGFIYGKQLGRLTNHGASLELGTDPELTRLLTTIDRFVGEPAFEIAEFEAQLGEVLLTTATAPALVAEVLIDRQEVDQAQMLLKKALDRYSTDLRLRQLMGLALSCAGEFDEARRWLEPLIAQNPKDEETTGICAGTYKRIWQAHRSAPDSAVEWLKKSNRLYRDGWKQSSKGNPYLGINAATTALWLGHSDEAKRLAGQVRALLNTRVAQVPRNGKHAPLSLGYWDQVTLAEALLVEGNFQSAAEEYQRAFTRHADQSGSIARTRLQIREILSYLHASLDDDGLLALAAPADQQRKFTN